MATKFGEEEEDVEVELELCLSLGGPFKKTNKSKILTDGKFNAVKDVNDGATETRRKRDAMHEEEQRSGGGEGECKRFKTECNGNFNGVNLDLSFSKMGNGSGQVKESIRSVTLGSPICSSSDVSDPSSSSRQEGGSGEISVQAKPVESPLNKIGTGTEETTQSINGSNGVVENQDLSNNSIAKVTSKPPKPRPNGNGVNGGLLPFAQMPCVTSTGNGPEGKTVNGFLYRYSKSEVSIICVCHGTSFSPAEFIIHAGGTNVSHPLRHITVVPSTF